MASAPPAVLAAYHRRNNIAAFQVTLEGRDLTDKLSPRLISLSITEKRGEAADDLSLVLHDHDGKLAIPKKGALLRVKLGWLQGDDVVVGLVDKGSFKVDEAEHSGPPDIVTIRARSADLAGDLRIRKDKVHTGTTIGAIVADVARKHGLKPSVAPELASIAVAAVGQHAKSDIAFVRDLGRRHDAVATVKAGKLILAPIGAGRTASGATIAGITLTRRDGDRHRYTRVERDKYDGVSASWHDPDQAKKRTVKAGADGTGSRRHLKRTYASEADAKHAADAEWRRIQRGAAEFEYDLALGRPDLSPERGVTLRGWKPEIDARKWLIAEVTHDMGGDGGLTTKIKLETAA